jgi:hypothetical protein
MGGFKVVYALFGDWSKDVHESQYRTIDLTAACSGCDEVVVLFDNKDDAQNCQFKFESKKVSLVGWEDHLVALAGKHMARESREKADTILQFISLVMAADFRSAIHRACGEGLHISHAAIKKNAVQACVVACSLEDQEVCFIDTDSVLIGRPNKNFGVMTSIKWSVTSGSPALLVVGPTEICIYVNGGHQISRSLYDNFAKSIRSVAHLLDTQGKGIAVAAALDIVANAALMLQNIYKALGCNGHECDGHSEMLSSKQYELLDTMQDDEECAEPRTFFKECKAAYVIPKCGGTCIGLFDHQRDKLVDILGEREYMMSIDKNTKGQLYCIPASACFRAALCYAMTDDMLLSTQQFYSHDRIEEQKEQGVKIVAIKDQCETAIKNPTLLRAWNLVNQGLGDERDRARASYRDYCLGVMEALAASATAHPATSLTLADSVPLDGNSPTTMVKLHP